MHSSSELTKRQPLGIYMNIRTTTLWTLIIGAAMSRLIPHPPNFTAIGAIALFGGSSFKEHRIAYAAPLAAMFLSDLVLGLHGLMAVVYLSILAITWLGKFMSIPSPAKVVAASLAGSLIFFLITNFAVWLSAGFYPMNFMGLVECFVAALPFLGNTAAGDLTFNVLLFGGYALLLKVSRTLSMQEQLVRGLDARRWAPQQ